MALPEWRSVDKRSSCHFLSYAVYSSRLHRPLAALPSVLLGQGQALDARRLTLGTDTLAVYTIRGNDTTLTGLIVDDLTLRTDGTRSLLVRTYRTEDRVLGSSLDTLIDAFPHLAPVRHRSSSDRGRERLDFRDGRVDGFLILANGDSVRVDAPLPRAAINASSFDIALRASPLSSNWSGDLRAFLSTSRTVVALHARVAGAEKIGGALCWRVEAEFAGLPVTFWIAQTSRRLCQQIMVIRPDLQILFAPRRATRGPRGLHNDSLELAGRRSAYAGRSPGPRPPADSVRALGNG